MKINDSGNQYLVCADNNEPILTVDTYETIMPKGKYEEETFCTIERVTCASNSIDERLSALKFILIHLRDEYGQYPGIDNKFNVLDEDEQQLITTLIEQGYISKQSLLNSEDFLGTSINIKNKEAMKNLINSTTKPRTNFSRNGFLPYNSTVQIREPRSFATERVPQLLRQIATKLYHFCCSKGLEPTELQIMYLNDSLFISANTKESIAAMKKHLVNGSAFKEALTTHYSYKGTEYFDRKISTRHAIKLASRLYGYYVCGDKRFTRIKNILINNTNTKLITLPNLVSAQVKGNIYFVVDQLRSNRHAEENLLDVVEHFALNIANTKFKPAVFGKKRPCFTCHARLDAVSKRMEEELYLQDAPFEFNQNKGFLFKGAAERQLKNQSSAEATAAALGKYSDVIYTSKEGDSSYATESDSEPENAADAEVNQLPIGKLSLKSGQKPRKA